MLSPTYRQDTDRQLAKLEEQIKKIELRRLTEEQMDHLARLLYYAQKMTVLIVQHWMTEEGHDSLSGMAEAPVLASQE
jgi:hypothetical protein